VYYPSLEAAAAGAPFRPLALNVPYLLVSQDVTLTASLYSQSLVQILLAPGVTVTLNTGIRLHNIQFLRSNGSTAKVVIAATQGGALDATQAVQLVDSRIGPDLYFSAVGHVLTARGRSVIDNAIGNPGTLYLYDVATAGVATGGPTVVDRRPGAAAATTGIDYANPVTLTAAAGLLANTAYYVTGNGYQLDLPPAANNLGKAIFVQIARTATGLYPVAGAGALALYAGETMSVRATAEGWKKTGGELIAMSAELVSDLNNQAALVVNAG
nr:hypothetical protein [Tanacetum cinerariifolium]